MGKVQPEWHFNYSILALLMRIHLAEKYKDG